MVSFDQIGSGGLGEQIGGDASKCWNSEKLIAFFENPLLLFRLKDKEFQSTAFSQPAPGWRSISTN
jgi:hypothetical protein